jgi:hypothetical protein
MAACRVTQLKKVTLIQDGDRAHSRNPHIPRVSGSRAERDQLSPIPEDEILRQAHVDPKPSAISSPRRTGIDECVVDHQPASSNEDGPGPWAAPHSNLWGATHRDIRALRDRDLAQVRKAIHLEIH